MYQNEIPSSPLKNEKTKTKKIKKIKKINSTQNATQKPALTLYLCVVKKKNKINDKTHVYTCINI